MGNLRVRKREDRRLRILQLLAGQPDYAINEAILKLGLEEYGHGITRDALRTDMAWLAEQELLNTSIAGTDVQVATITGRGVDVASGLANVPGVKHPRPGE